MFVGGSGVSVGVAGRRVAVRVGGRRVAVLAGGAAVSLGTISVVLEAGASVALGVSVAVAASVAVATVGDGCAVATAPPASTVGNATVARGSVAVGVPPVPNALLPNNASTITKSATATIEPITRADGERRVGKSRYSSDMSRIGAARC